jgi:GntR family transcriptional regulator / MocR family aminotransferase
MHVAAVARTSLDFDHVTEALLRNNVKIHALSRYYLGTATRTGLIFGYGAVDLPEMARGLRLLRTALQSGRLQRL